MTSVTGSEALFVESILLEEHYIEMAEDLMNIIYENENKQKKNEGTPTHNTPSTGGIGNMISYDWLGSSLAQINLTSITSSALKLADEIHQSLSIQAETASSQMNKELVHATSQHESLRRSSSIYAPLPWETDNEALRHWY